MEYIFTNAVKVAISSINVSIKTGQKKICAIKISLIRVDGEIGENFLLAKISAYIRYYNCPKFLMHVLHVMWFKAIYSLKLSAWAVCVCACASCDDTKYPLLI